MAVVHCGNLQYLIGVCTTSSVECKNWVLRWQVPHKETQLSKSAVATINRHTWQNISRAE